MKVYAVDEILLNRLKKKITSDLWDFLPKGCFKFESSLNVNGKEFSWDEKWGLIALTQGGQLCYESDCNIINLSPREFLAAKVLYDLGDLASCECTIKPEEIKTQAKNNLRISLQEYIDQLLDQEKKPFISLLEDGSYDGIKRMTEDRAFLLQCFKDGIENDINSVWLHIQSSLGKDGFRFKSASNCTATTINDRKVTKDNLGRCLNALIKLKGTISK